MSFLSLLFGGHPQKSDHITILDKASFKAAISSKNITLIDVRTPREYLSGHIKNAVNIDYFDTSNFIKAIKGYDKEQPIFIYCRSGNRSQKAAKKLDSIGFKNIFDLKGGYMNWN
ncbi:rhodanese-like domain-containing protein [Psychroserpens sp. BH13MA-6]